MVMKKCGVILLATIFLGLVGCSSSSPKTTTEIGTWLRLKSALHARFTGGESALRQASEAKAAAKSYKMRVEMRLHPGDPFVTVEEVGCPDRQRMSASLGDRPMYEAVRVAQTSYVKEQEKWVQSPIPPEVFPCGQQPGAPAPWAILNEGRDMSSALAQLVSKARAQVTVGNLIVANGSPCQEWEVTFGHPGSKTPNNAPGMGNMRYTICIDAETNLPNQVVMGTGGIIIKYYDWNKPVTINAPV